MGDCNRPANRKAVSVAETKVDLKWKTKLKLLYQFTHIKHGCPRNLCNPQHKYLCSVPRYFINLQEKTTTWEDPRSKYKQQVFQMQVRSPKPSEPVFCSKSIIGKKKLVELARIPEEKCSSVSHSELSGPSISKLPRAVS